jgi:hypothetical protein
MHRSLALLIVFVLAVGSRAEERALSHPPLRTVPPPSARPLPTANVQFVDASAGDDAAAGTKEKPWRTVNHAVAQAQPGDTICLRGGIYYENVHVAKIGSAEKPITIRSYPGEQAILDGGIAEFFRDPAAAWLPAEGAPAGGFRSARTYPNLRTLVGSFGDSMIGLQTYYHAQDLRAENELVDWEDWDRQQQTDIKPLYCGPGLWYDPQTGYIHLRLAHTHLPAPIDNYRGPTDPRHVPLVLTPFHSVPLAIDGAQHVKFQDLVIRGAGYTAVQIDQASHIEFDNVTIWCGTYGIRASGVAHLKLLHCGLYGSLAPWTFRGDASKRDYPGRPHRNLSRLNTHALIEIESGRESSVYAFPQNDHWEIANCELTDSHDGVYLGGINVDFHHNVLDNLQDDGIYLSPMYLRHRLDQTVPRIRVHENRFGTMLTALAFGGPEPVNEDEAFVYRNLFDLRGRVNSGRPSTRQGEPGFSSGKLIGDHGSPPWSTLSFYHNTVIAAEPSRDVAMAALGGVRPGHPRRVFNNIFLHLERLPALVPPQPDADCVFDGNLYWSPDVDGGAAEKFFARFRASPQFEGSKQRYAAGSSSHDRIGDPRIELAADQAGKLLQGSPAVNSGVELPDEWPDPARGGDEGQRDIGALPLGAEKAAVGRLTPSMSK